MDGARTGSLNAAGLQKLLDLGDQLVADLMGSAGQLPAR